MQAGWHSQVWFLHQIDCDKRKAYMVETDLQRLSGALFLDGRTDFTRGRAKVCDLSRYLADETSHPVAPTRMIFHMGFCGSTHLSRLIEEARCGVVLKEPHSLVDLANRRARAPISGEISKLTGRCINELHRVGAGFCDIIVKPSNWANNLLLPIALDRGPNDRFITMSMEPRSFVQAIFRGGRDRLSFALAAVSHMATACDRERDLALALRGCETLEGAARAAVLLYVIQHALFARAAVIAPEAVLELRYEKLVADPMTTLQRAARHLNLFLDETRASAAVAIGAKRDAKCLKTSFSPDRQASTNDSVNAHYGSLIDDALAWGRRNLTDDALASA